MHVKNGALRKDIKDDQNIGVKTFYENDLHAKRSTGSNRVKKKKEIAYLFIFINV